MPYAYCEILFQMHELPNCTEFAALAHVSGENWGDAVMDGHTVVGRAVEILDCVANASGLLPLAILFRRTGIPKPIGVSGRGSKIDARGVRPTLARFAESLATELMPRSATEAS
jgi:hypothetical protein